MFQFLTQKQLFRSSGLSSFSLPRYAQMFSSSSCCHRRTLSSRDHVRVWRNVGNQIIYQILIKFLITVPYKHLSTNRQSYNNQLLSMWKICQLFQRHALVKLFSASWNRHKILHFSFKINYKYIPPYIRKNYISVSHWSIHIFTTVNVLKYNSILKKHLYWEHHQYGKHRNSILIWKNIMPLLCPSHLWSRIH